MRRTEFNSTNEIKKSLRAGGIFGFSKEVRFANPKKSVRANALFYFILPIGIIYKGSSSRVMFRRSFTFRSEKAPIATVPIFKAPACR